MTLFGSKDTARTAEITRLASEIADMHGEIKALRRERANLQEVDRLSHEVERLKLEKGRLTEINDRKIRETEHKVGLLRKQQDHDVANAKRETMLEVREANLSKDQERFEAQMRFHREAQAAEIDRLVHMQEAILERLPNIEATFGASLGTATARRSKDGD